MNKKYCTIYLVRHGKTDWNNRKLVQGHTDIKLNLEGRDSARELAKKLKNINFDKAYSSDLLRAKQTAEIIALEHKLTVKTTETLRERDFGSIEGKSHSVFPEMDKILDRLDEKVRYSYKFDSNMKMESDEEVMNRFLVMLREIAIANLGKKILVVTHGGPMWMFLVKLGFVSYQHHLEINNLAYIKLESNGIDFFVKETNGVNKK